jgi:hypothetical protein
MPAWVHPHASAMIDDHLLVGDADRGITIPHFRFAPES